jgi:hypothetical protein
VHLRVAGVTIRVAWSEPDLAGLRIAPGSAAIPFLIDAAPPDVDLEVVARDRIDQNDDDAKECLFDSGGPWRLYRHDEGLLFRFFSSAFGPAPYQTALVSRDFSRGRITLNRAFFGDGAIVDPIAYPLDELLVIGVLGRGSGLELHACGIVDGVTGYLFAGQSGAGKSTMARLWMAERDAIVLSDDRVVVRAEHDGHWMYGTPWHGEAPLASPRRSRLGGIFFLRHAARDEVVAVPAADAAARLFACSFPPFHDAAAIAFSLEFLASLVTHVPCAELRFAPTASVLQCVRRAGRAVPS